MPNGEIKSQFWADVIINQEVLGRNLVTQFEWKSFVNGGYEIRGQIIDPGHRLLNSLELWDKDYLRNVRKNPMVVLFKLGYPGGPEWETNNGKYIKAVISDLSIYGNPTVGAIEFVAIDPPSWYLNAGKGDGKIFKGKVSDVIKKVVNESTGGAIKAMVSETKDDDNGRWGLHRQDPKTFITSLIDWSARVLKNEESRWMVGVDDDTIYIQDSIDYLARQKHIADIQVSTGGKGSFIRNDVNEYAVLNNTLLTAYQNRLITQGISAVSGKFIDKQVESKKVEIKDDNTTQKLNAKIDSTMSYDKPDSEYSTSIVATPELNGGEMGIKFEEWMGGRPQQLYLAMLPMIMRCRFTVRGDYRFFDNKNLGVATIKVKWKDIGTDGERKDFFLHGHWIVYGFHHRLQGGEEPHWWTDIYAYRIDQDAQAKQIP